MMELVAGLDPVDRDILRAAVIGRGSTIINLSDTSKITELRGRGIKVQNVTNGWEISWHI